jgi:RecA/RadA recombinase
MAYVDQNGLVLIDEIEAGEDVKKLTAALNSMDEALEIINQIANINAAFSGDTANAIEVSSTELIKQVNLQKTAIEEEIRFINEVVTKYQTIDTKMKDQINSTLN